MTIESFVRQYNLHDSYITKIHHDSTQQLLTIHINFAFWMQEFYEEGTPENGMILLRFSNVREFLCNEGDPAGAFVGILGSEYRDNRLVIKLLDDETNAYFELAICADSVEVIREPLP